MRLAVALGERDPDALDYYSGPESEVADVRRNPPKLPLIAKSAKDAADGLAGLQVAPGQAENRKSFLARQLRAVAARVGFVWRVQSSLPKPSFDEEVHEFFGIRLAPSANEQLPRIRSQIAKLLSGPGRLVDRYAAFERRFVIPEARVPAVMSRAVELCRAATVSRIPLPPGEGTQLEFVRNKPWSAFSYYKGHYRSVIEVNVDLGLTPDRALELACHEGYPGHHVFNSLVEQNLVMRDHRPEWQVQPTFSPQSFLSEASATVAGKLAFSETERAHLEKTVLFPLAGLKAPEMKHYLEVEELVDALHPAELAIAREYLDDRLEFARAAQALEEQALMGQTDATLRYLNEYRSYVVTYTEGRDRVLRWTEHRAAQSGDRSNLWTPFLELLKSPELLTQQEK